MSLLPSVLLILSAAMAGDILWYSGGGGAEVSSLAALSAAGGTCSSGLDQTPLWPKDLLSYRLVLLSVTSQAPTEAQVQDLEDYLALGRTLVLVGDSAWLNTAHVGIFNDLLSGWSAESRFASGISQDGGCMKQADRTAETALTEGVTALTYAYSGDITVPEKSAAEVLFVGESGQSLVVAEGNLVLAADLDIFAEYCSMGLGNATFFENLYRGACLAEAADADGDGFISSACGGDDCDDRDASLRPDRAWYPDADGDGLGDPAGAVASCCAPPDLIDDGEDCDDADPDVLLGAAFYFDEDGDGHGDPARFTRACSPPEGTSALGDDCDDTDPLTSPSGEEVCDGRDNDCDAAADEDVLLGWYVDADGDGHGAEGGEATLACTAPEGRAGSADDCDDADAAVFPGAEEVCNASDDDCDGRTDEEVECDGEEGPGPAPRPDDEEGCGGRRSAGGLVLGGLSLWWGCRRDRRRRRAGWGGRA